MEKWNIGDRLLCIKTFKSRDYNGGKLTGVYDGNIYTVRGFLQPGHIVLNEVRFIGTTREAGFYNPSPEYFINASELLKEE